MSSLAKQLIYNHDLYNASFIESFGENSHFWANESWRRREHSLRHDMVCVLLCGLNKDTNLIDRLDGELSNPAAKRRKIELEYANPAASSSSSSDRGAMDRPVNLEEFFPSREEDQDQEQYQYVLIEGHPIPEQQQNTAVARAGMTFRPNHLYDIVDVKNKLLIEVKVTINFERHMNLRYTYKDPIEHVSVCLIHPSSGAVVIDGPDIPNPNLRHALSFLELRRTVCERIGYFDTEDIGHKDWIEEIMCCDSLNLDIALWTDEIWRWRDVIKSEDPHDRPPAEGNLWDVVGLNKLSDLIEDCTLRDAPFAPITMKVLPPMMCGEIETKQEEDEQILSVLFENLTFPGNNDISSILNWILERWKEPFVGPFNFVTAKNKSILPDILRESLGIGMKGTYENDDEELLVQKDFKTKQKLRMSFWVGNMIKDLAQPHGHHLDYMMSFKHEEAEIIHPIAKISKEFANKYFTLVSGTNIAPLCSKVKGFYSRMGGAFLSRNFTGDNKGYIAVFPLYSVGYHGGDKVRKVSGFIVRGPHHAKASSDRISFLSIELLRDDEYWERYQKLVKNVKIVVDNFGRRWAFRQNSIMKADCSYLAFINNSLFTSANSAGDFILNQESAVADINLNKVIDRVTSDLGGWMMERVAESVLIALMAGSEEEGALAIVRKLFMTAMALNRKQTVLCCDLVGLANALNECLITGAVAMHYAYEIKMTLKQIAIAHGRN